jgi:DNA-binding HxlR family transcriptional regulator
VSASRTYDDPCGIARALNLLGERWGLLVARELMLGPKRFGQLRASLAGISPNVLAQRLRELEAADIVTHEVLEPPASVAVYSLTNRGADLRPILIELGRWGSREALASSNQLTPDALMLALETSFIGSDRFAATYALRLDGESYQLRVSDSSISTSRGRPDAPTTSITADAATFRGYAFGRASFDDLTNTGSLTISGSRTAARRLPRLFRVPAPVKPMPVKPMPVKTDPGAPIPSGPIPGAPIAV